MFRSMKLTKKKINIVLALGMLVCLAYLVLFDSFGSGTTYSIFAQIALLTFGLMSSLLSLRLPNKNS